MSVGCHLRKALEPSTIFLQILMQKLQPLYLQKLFSFDDFSNLQVLNPEPNKNSKNKNKKNKKKLKAQQEKETVKEQSIQKTAEMETIKISLDKKGHRRSQSQVEIQDDKKLQDKKTQNASSKNIYKPIVLCQSFNQELSEKPEENNKKKKKKNKQKKHKNVKPE